MKKPRVYDSDRARYRRNASVANARILAEYSLAPTLPEEIWCPTYHPAYEVSNLGRVRCAITRKGTRAGNIIKPYSDRSGYARVTIQSVESRRGVRVQRLVAEAFIGPQPSPAFEVNHLDRDKLNNRPDNLEWITHIGNISHALGRVIRDIPPEEVAAIRVFRKYFSETELAERLGIGRSTIGHIMRRETHAHD